MKSCFIGKIDIYFLFVTVYVTDSLEVFFPNDVSFLK